MESKKGRYQSFSGYSMYPALKPGDLLEIDENAKLIPGDIYSYGTDNYSITHRLEKVEHGFAVLKGDRYIKAERIPVSYIIGKIIRVIRGNKVIEPPPRRSSFWLIYRYLLLFYFFLKEKLERSGDSLTPKI